MIAAVASALAAAAIVVALVVRDVAIRVLADRRDARQGQRADTAAMQALEARMAELEGNAERWNTAAREVSAMSGRRKA